MEKKQPSNNYPPMFRQYIGRSTSYLLGEVAKAEGILSTELCNQVLHTLGYALRLDEIWPMSRELLGKLATPLEQLGYRREWIPYLEQGVKQSQAANDLMAEAEFHYHLGILYRLMGQFDEAHGQLQLSIEQYQSLGKDEKQAGALAQRAFLLRLERQLDEAGELVAKALSLLPKEEGLEHAYVYLVQGAIAIEKEQWDKAQACINRAICLWERQHDTRMLAWGFGNLGLILRNKQEYTKALMYYQKAITIFENFRDPAREAITRMNLGNTYLSVNQPQKAIEQYQRAEPVLQDTQDKFHLTMCHMNQGISYRMMKQWSLAEKILSECILEWKVIRNIHFLLNTFDELAQVYTERNMYQSAEDTLIAACKYLYYMNEKSTHKRWYDKLTKDLDRCQKLNASSN